MNQILRVLDNESGATAVEYGIILATVVIAAFVAFNVLGGVSVDLFERAVDAFPPH